MKELQSIGTILVIISISIQLNLFVSIYKSIINYYLQILFLLFFPLFMLITSFFCFYFVNIVYNIISPPKWIEQNSKYLSYYIPLNISLENNNTNAEIELVSQNEYYNWDNDIYKIYSFDIEQGFPIQSSLNNYLLPFSNNNLIQEINAQNVICTIQIPVYTENFEETLKPTIDNVLKCCRNYNEKNKNTKINVFINDDGLQKISEDEQKKRVNYYNSNCELFYIARPPNDRQGKFKKASNMNCALQQYFNIKNGNQIANNYWVGGGCYGNFEIGKYIILLDSDSRLSPNCFAYLFAEMEQDPNLGFLQIKTKAMKVANNLWENAISHFTNALYSVNFFYSCSNGFPSPLVGHNCLLRWDAMIHVEKELNGYHKRPICTWKVWDETRVSEDFVMSLTMQSLGYYGKYIMYDCGMMEGVSLTILDEIVKLKKFMFGILEIMFYPITEWYKKGITTHLFHQLLLTEHITFATKYALMSYIGSYFAVMMSPMFTLLYFFAMFLFSNIRYTFYFVENPEFVLLCCVIIFLVLSFLSNVIVRLKHGFYFNFWELIWEELFYGIFLTCFFGGLSYHLCIMFVIYFLKLNAVWGTTNKELQKITGLTFIYEHKKMYVVYGILFAFVCWVNIYYNSEFFRLSIPIYAMIFMHCIFPLFTM